MAHFLPRKHELRSVFKRFWNGLLTLVAAWVGYFFLVVALCPVGSSDISIFGLSVGGFMALVCGWFIYCLWFPDNPFTDMVIPSLEVIAEVFEDETTPDDVVEKDRDVVVKAGVKHNVRPNRKMHYAARVALIAKAEVAQLEHTKANELVYRRICRDEMVKHGVRPTHIAKILPLAVACCFVQTNEELLADAILESETVQNCKPAREH